MILRYDGLGSVICISLLLRLSNIVLGQDTTSATNQQTPTTMATSTPPSTPTPKNQPSFPLLSSSALPSTSDSAPSSNNNHSMNSTGLVNYYFVFLALIVAVVGGVVYLFIRKRHRAMLRTRYSQQEALTRDLGGARPGGGWSNWHPERTRGRYWQGRWRSAEASREEGLNEQGEAPPPYVPKRRSEEVQREVTEPAVPLQTLSRDGAGLKPPDYSEYYLQNPDSQGRNSVASASSSRDVERRTSL
jgi:hypothetical protein